MIFNGFSGCNCSGQRRQMNGLSIYSDGEASLIAASDAGAVTAQMGNASATRSIMLGVGTGIVVWFITRALDKLLENK